MVSLYDIDLPEPSLCHEQLRYVLIIVLHVHFLLLQTVLNQILKGKILMS